MTTRQKEEREQPGLENAEQGQWQQQQINLGAFEGPCLELKA